MGMTNFLNNLFQMSERGVTRGPGGSGGMGEGANNGPGGIGNNPSDPRYNQMGLVPGVPTVQPAVLWGPPGYGRNLMNYSGHGWNIAGTIYPPQGGHPDLYSFREHAPAIPSRLAGANEIAWQIFRNGTYDEYIQIKAPPVPSAGWVPPGAQLPDATMKW